MLDVGGEIADEIQVAKLAWRRVRFDLFKGGGDGFVVGKDGKGAAFQHEAKMLDCVVDGQQLAVVCRIFLLGGAQLATEVAQGLPHVCVFDVLLDDGAEGDVGGVGHQGEVCTNSRVREGGGVGQSSF